MSYEAFREADKRATKILSARGIKDPRLGADLVKPSDYEAIRKYDAQLASEIISILRKPAVSVSEIPNNLKPKGDWASSAYDR